jgi:4-hydroxy-tetrahydrodipicolinate reductase
MTRLLVTGVAGRMGGAIVRALAGAQGLSLVAAVERPGSKVIGQDAGFAAQTGALSVRVEGDLPRALTEGRPEVVIDFTAPEASVAHAAACAKAKVALVIGTTGFSPEQKEQIAESAKQVPIVMAPNMSIGVNVMFKVAAELARALGDAYEIDVLESHHRRKKDAPSGTALRIAEEIARATGRTKADFRATRDGMIGERPRSEIGIQTLRGGDVVGEHTVFYFGDGERLELTHRATSRDQFAQGAVRAAKWVAGKAPGLYDMLDVLGLR